MEIKNAKFITSITGNQPFPGKGLPELAVSGKSNVGKSTFINCMCNNHKLARTSQEPGKTRVINIFDCGVFHLVDLPGYGYAKVSGAMQRSWGAMMEGYLSGSQELLHVFQLVDLRHEPTEDDIMMINYMRHYDVPFTIVATKADKLSRSQRFSNIARICRTLGVQPWEVIPFSGVDRTGRDIVLDRIDKILDGEDLRDPAVAQRMGPKPKTEEETAADEAKKAETMAPAPVQSVKEPQPAAKPKAEAKPVSKPTKKETKPSAKAGKPKSAAKPTKTDKKPARDVKQSKKPSDRQPDKRGAKNTKQKSAQTLKPTQRKSK
ncbi:MAG: YihA family ribosome biogenesis GTP-binding protein [Clostridiales bacterium]|nr:YihA family ribosome biogenesis GTP-binding protein [Clostridiales bacterium]